MNQNFRTMLWTGRDMQLMLMSIPVRGDIGVERHPDVDQFIRIESGHAKVYMGGCQNALREVGTVNENYAMESVPFQYGRVVGSERNAQHRIILPGDIAVDIGYSTVLRPAAAIGGDGNGGGLAAVVEKGSAQLAVALAGIYLTGAVLQLHRTEGYAFAGNGIQALVIRNACGAGVGGWP